jgi:hypothetical protein
LRLHDITSFRMAWIENHIKNHVPFPGARY